MMRNQNQFSNGVRYFPLFIADWQQGTRKLTLIQKAIYFELLCMIYTEGGPVLDDATEIARALHIDVRRWRSVRARLLELDKIQLITLPRPRLLSTKCGYLMNRRAATELAHIRRRQKSGRSRVDLRLI
jgi:uncharacterized protein DUF1376